MRASPILYPCLSVLLFSMSCAPVATPSLSLSFTYKDPSQSSLYRPVSVSQNGGFATQSTAEKVDYSLPDDYCYVLHVKKVSKEEGAFSSQCGPFSRPGSFYGFYRKGESVALALRPDTYVFEILGEPNNGSNCSYAELEPFGSTPSQEQADDFLIWQKNGQDYRPRQPLIFARGKKSLVPGNNEVVLQKLPALSQSESPQSLNVGQPFFKVNHPDYAQQCSEAQGDSGGVQVTGTLSYSNSFFSWTSPGIRQSDAGTAKLYGIGAQALVNADYFSTDGFVLTSQPQFFGGPQQ